MSLLEYPRMCSLWSRCQGRPNLLPSFKVQCLCLVKLGEISTQWPNREKCIAITCICIHFVNDIFLQKQRRKNGTDLKCGTHIVLPMYLQDPFTNWTNFLYVSCTRVVLYVYHISGLYHFFFCVFAEKCHENWSDTFF